MKAVILAGGRGTRLAEETQWKPKPLVEAGGYPLIWHVMQSYAAHGVTDFYVLSGFKGNLIREYFANFWMNHSDITFDLSSTKRVIRKVRSFPWNVTVVDTGLDTPTGSRIAYLKNLFEEDFFVTYGDGIGNVDLLKSLQLHKTSKCIATLTAVRPPARFGALSLNLDKVESFKEKPDEGEGWINGGFFIFKPEIFDYLTQENCTLEIDVLPVLAKAGELAAHRHEGFWQPVDNMRDLEKLNYAIETGLLPWIE